MNTQEQVTYLTYEQAQDFVERIAERTKVFSYNMSENEKEAMSQLLSDIGVKISDLIDVSNLADNYAVNAEIVTPSEVESYQCSTDGYSTDIEHDSLFQWEESDGTHYCYQW